MCYENEILSVIPFKKNFFDFIFSSGKSIIMDYSHMDKEIIISDATGSISLGDQKQRTEISSIQGLQKTMNGLVQAVLEIINKTGIYYPGIELGNMFTMTAQGNNADVDLPKNYYNSSFLVCPSIEPLPLRISIQPEDIKFFIDQLVFDILYDKYRRESPLLTLRQYSISHSQYVWSDVSDGKLFSDTVRKCIVAAIPRQIATMKTPALRANIQKLGVDPDAYFEYLAKLNEPFGTEKKKPKIIWDYIYYNGTQKLITGKQYKRSFYKSDNYSRNVIADIFDTYDKFVSTVFIKEQGDDKDYFQRSMDFFHLEIYKRIDFIYKLACRLEGADSPFIDKNHALVKRFHPKVLGIYADNNHPVFGTRFNYYRPMLMLEESWQKQKKYVEPMFFDTLQKHQLVRAKAYELFRYHNKFVSENYTEISSFIRDHYNILAYHDPKKIWIQKDKKTTHNKNIRVSKALEINEALFGNSNK